MFFCEFYEVFKNTSGGCFWKAYHQVFPEIEIIVKTKNILSPWINEGKKIIQKKTKIMWKVFLKKKTCKNDENHKTYEHLFEEVKNNSKKLYVQNKLKKMRMILRTLGKYLNKWLVNPKRLFSKLLDY